MACPKTSDRSSRVGGGVPHGAILCGNSGPSLLMHQSKPGEDSHPPQSLWDKGPWWAGSGKVLGIGSGGLSPPPPSVAGGGGQG